jgi:uncharacterized protein YcsI (UPF0317 family)
MDTNRPGPAPHPISLAVRRDCRAGELTGPTADLAPGYVQGNLVILPERLAARFESFCRLNPKPCPIVGVSRVGDPFIPELGFDLDIRTDLPRYRVWRNGELVNEPTDILDYWRNDLVTFVIGCSFSFEQALIAEGLRIRHIEQRCNVPMYRTNIDCAVSGPFGGPMVVSMRPFKPADAIRAIQITSRFPAVHGAPIHFGEPSQIGITNLDEPDFGDRVRIEDGEVPVFWACGVTPQTVILASRPELAITHAPGAMLVTDRRNTELAIP